MKIDFSTWTASDYAAWWGAIIATLAAIWNIISAIRSGPRINVRAIPDMQIFPRQSITGDTSYISVTAINKGNSPTTITHLCGYHYKSVWCLLRRRKTQFVINTNPFTGKQVPYLLNPGEEWANIIDQNELRDKFSSGFLYIGVMHNQRKHAVLKRVKIVTYKLPDGSEVEH